MVELVVAAVALTSARIFLAHAGGAGAAVGCYRLGADAGSLRRCWDLSDIVRVEAVTPGQHRELGVRVMSNIPLDIQRRCEQRWAARFARRVPPSRRTSTSMKIRISS
jgi:hypothetical protein